MKKNYEELELKVIRFAQEDVITASGEDICAKVFICNNVLIPCNIECRTIVCRALVCEALCKECIM